MKVEELYYYLDKVKKELDESSVMKEFIDAKNKVFENKELISLVEEYKKSYNSSLKEKIIDYKEFREYKICENEVNFLILSINKILKEITSKGGRNCESHRR